MLTRNDIHKDLLWFHHAPPLCAPNPIFLGHPEAKGERFGLRNVDAAIEVVCRRALPRRLGRYFEMLNEASMHQRDFDAAPHFNRVLQVGRRTVGEFDALYVDAAGLWAHREIAVKYYLQTEDSPEWKSFLGPSCRDRLDIKLERMLSHQLKLSESQEAKRFLNTLGIEVARVEALVLGAVFFHAKHRGDLQHRSFSGATKNFERGLWLYAKELSGLFDCDERCVVLERLRWLRGQGPGLPIDWRALDSVDRPTMVWAQQLAMRVFIVPNTWPGRLLK